MKGTIVRLVRNRGFGFIHTEHGTEIFFHATSLPPGSFDALTEGQAVEFDEEADPRQNRHRAVNVRVVY